MTELGAVGRPRGRPTVQSTGHIASQPRPPSRPNPLGRMRILVPLRRRNFALLWGGMAISLTGDGIYAIAIVWEALRLSNAAMAISLVGVAWTVPTVGFLLLGGALSDRFDRRRLMLIACLAQALVVGAMAALQTAGVLRLWSLLGLVALYGTAEAFFLPTFEAVVPTLVAADELAEASALDQVIRPLSLRLLGPALGGIVISLTGTGPAFALDAVTFLISAGTLIALRAIPGGYRLPARGQGHKGRLEGLAEGLRFVRANRWLWRTLLAASLTLLLFYGPYEVVLPFLVKNGLHGGSATLGAIRALGGAGALVGALVISQTGPPGRAMRAMFAGWALQCLTLAGFAAAHRAWLFAAISLLGGACGAVGNVIWGTQMKTRVPNRLLGRVASLDLVVSIGLVPLSFALAGPAAALLGPRWTLLGGGLLAAAMLVVCRTGAEPRRDQETRPQPGEKSHSTRAA